MATINGTSGNDVINGTSSADNIWAHGGNDVVNAGGGNDTVGGAIGNDELNGDGGNDVIYGAAGADTIDGGSGDDEFFGGSGNDELTGGSGADTFAFENGHGDDVITDFNVSDGDTIELGGGISSFEISAGNIYDGPDGIPGTFDDIGVDCIIDTGSGSITIEAVFDAVALEYLIDQIADTIDIV